MIPAKKTVLILGILTAGALLTLVRPVLIIPVLVADIIIFIIMVYEYLFIIKKNTVAICRQIPKKLSISQKNPITLTFTNYSKQTLNIKVRDSIPEHFFYDFKDINIILEPFSRKKFVYHVTPEKRGEFLFGDIFIRIQRNRGFTIRPCIIPAAAKARIYPNLIGISKYETIARAKHLVNYGIHASSLKGSGREFEMLREYQRDDEYRNISWKATAKKGFPIVKEFQIEKSQNVLVCLNCGRSMKGLADKYTKFDYALNASLMLSYLCQRFGDKIGLCLFAENIKNFVPLKQGKHQINRIIEVLYNVEPETIFVDYTELVKFISTKNIKRSLIIIFTDLFDEEQSKDILASIPLLHPKHLILCVSMKDSALRTRLQANISDIEDTFKYIAAFELNRERNLMSRKLVEKGVFVLDEEAKNLSVSLINKYIEIKSRHLL